MHEIGIANAIIEAGQAETARHAGSKLLRIGVRIGTLAGVDNDALRFAFAALTQGTQLDGVGFEIQSCPRRNLCLGCGHEFESALYSEPCPRCASEQIILAGGEELDLAYVELEEA
ncbi:MAG: hydrogenase maturation nickel metallochaperone HypA [Edaphobacter sp.]